MSLLVQTLGQLVLTGCILSWEMFFVNVFHLRAESAPDRLTKRPEACKMGADQRKDGIWDG